MADRDIFHTVKPDFRIEASVECVGRKIRYGQHLPERGASPSWLPASTVAQGCQGRRRRGKAGALTGLWHGAIFSPFLCTTPNAWKPLLWLIFSKSATHTFYRRAKNNTGKTYKEAIAAYYQILEDILAGLLVTVTRGEARLKDSTFLVPPFCVSPHPCALGLSLV